MSCYEARVSRLLFRAFGIFAGLTATIALAGNSRSLAEEVPTIQPVSERRLTTDGKLKSNLQFIKQGDELVFTLEEKFDLLSLMRLRLSDGQLERLHPAANTTEIAVSFAAGERRYAYLRNDGNLHVSIVLKNEDTGAVVEHNPGGGFAGISNLSCAPDGSQVVFAFPDRNGPQQIYTLSFDGQDKTGLTNSEGFDICPQFSADGKRIVFASSREGNFDICTMNAKGTDIVQLTTHEGLDTHPAWSLDGQQIAFTSLRDGNYDIYIINSDGSNLRRLTTNPEADDYACWHPDGKRLVVVSERRGKRDLYEMRLAE